MKYLNFCSLPNALLLIPKYYRISTSLSHPYYTSKVQRSFRALHSLSNMTEETDFFQLSCPQYTNNIELSLDEYTNYALGMDTHMPHFEFSPSLTTTNSSPSREFVAFSVHDTHRTNVAFASDDSSPLDMEELELILKGDIEDVSGWLKGVEEKEKDCPLLQCSDHERINDGKSNHDHILSLSIVSGDPAETTPIQQPLSLPTEGLEINIQLSLNHLVKAYVEAMENEQSELADVITGRVSEKVCPIGEVWERLFYYTFHPSDKQSDYLKQESGKNFNRAFEAFYRIFPFGMIAHFTANSAILDSRPHDADDLHIVDFDMGEGVQWSSMIMSLGQQYQQKELGHKYYGSAHIPPQPTLRITTIKWEEDDLFHAPSWRSFEETKRRLQDYANSFGVVLKVEEMDLQDLASEVRKMMRSKGGNNRDFFAFNCMWALPHMGRMRSRRHVMEFLGVAKDSLANNNGILTFGDGGAWEIFKGCPGFGSFFERYMGHYHALLESIEWHIPIRLAEARVAMECLFVAPYVSSLAWMQEWEEMLEGCDLKTGFGFEGLRLSNEESLMEAKEMAREGETPYGVRIDGDDQNEIILEWRRTPLLRVSAWR